MKLQQPIRFGGLALMAGMIALGGCGSSAPDDPEQASLTPSTAASAEPAIQPSEAESPAPAATAGLPLPLGYYAVNTDCSAALQDGNLGIVIEADVWRDIDGDYELLPVQDLGGGTFKLGEAADTLRQTGPKRFVADEGSDYQRELLWCADERPD